MNSTSSFYSDFWNIYIWVIVVGSFIWMFYLLFTQSRLKGKPGKAETTGHAWDGIEEYNNPLPKWWLYLFILTLLFGIAYLAVYPGLGDYKGISGWTSHGQYDNEVKEANKKYDPMYASLAALPIEQMVGNKDAHAVGQNLFNTYCIQCHGSDAKGNKGFPNLTDDDWLWGGTPEKINETITKGRMGVMPAWGPVLGEEGVKDVAQYVLSLSGREGLDQGRIARGNKIFHSPPANCQACHGAEGKGQMGIAPNLSDKAWLWGGSEKDVIATITNGHQNQMPAWGSFLDKNKIAILTGYVYGLSHKDGKAKPTDGPTPAAAPAAASAPAASAPAAVADEAKTVVENGVVKMYFATGKSDLAANTKDALATIADGVKAGKTVVISGYHDSTGNAAQNAELAKNRAKQVKEALVAMGVPADKIVLEKPASTSGGSDNAEARRVEATLK